MNGEDLLRLLAKREGSYISGSELARRLCVSRSAVWKWIEQLRAEGYQIDSATNRGYRLRREGDVLSAEGVRRYLRNPDLTVEVYPTVTSTNTLLKSRAAAGAPEGTVLVAAEQTGGRGRLGRSFFSPAGTGVYFSALLRPRTSAAETTRLTACAAVAVAETLEELSGKPAGIKWVNDVLVDGKKVCGILTEASIDCESGATDYVVLGVGVNLTVPGEAFPEELRDVAGAAFGGGSLPDLRCRVAAGVLDRFFGYYRDPDGAAACFDAYKRRSLALGRPVTLLALGKPPEEAQAIDLDPDFALVVKTADGTVRRVSSGEVSLRL